MSDTLHFADRIERQKFIESIGRYGAIIAEVYTDRGHPNGPEIHKITDNAIIVVYNERTGNHVTDLIARPRQLLRYKIPIPTKVLELAYQHYQLGYNNR